MACPPEARMRATACSRSTASRELRTTRAPRPAAISAVASPMPLDAPVITMTCSPTGLRPTLMGPPSECGPRARFASVVTAMVHPRERHGTCCGSRAGCGPGQEGGRAGERTRKEQGDEREAPAGEAECGRAYDRDGRNGTLERFNANQQQPAPRG